MKIISINKPFFVLNIIIFIFGVSLLKVKADDCEILEKAINLFGNNLKEAYNNATRQDCCDFIGVVCDEENHISELNFILNYKSFDGKEGEAITEISKLNYLTKLNLNGFMFSNGFPPEVGKLKNLKTLILSHNSFVSEIPDEIGNLTELENLDLSYNYLNGKIPKSICNLKKLKKLNIGNNRLKGTIPYECKDLNEIEELSLNDNMSLYGFVPLYKKVSTCDYYITSMCVSKNAKCKGNVRECTKSDIEKANKDYGMTEMDKYEKELLNEPFTINTPLIIGIIVLILVIIILIAMIKNKISNRNSEKYEVLNIAKN